MINYFHQMGGRGAVCMWVCVCVCRRESERVPTLVTPSRRGVTGSGQEPSSCQRRGPISKHVRLGKNKRMVMDPDSIQNQDSLCWR
jgi:hypothetical protein